MTIYVIEVLGLYTPLIHPGAGLPDWRGKIAARVRPTPTCDLMIATFAVPEGTFTAGKKVVAIAN